MANIHRDGCTKEHDGYGWCRMATSSEYKLIAALDAIVDPDGSLTIVMDGATVLEDGTVRAYIAHGPMLEGRYAIEIKDLNEAYR